MKVAEVSTALGISKGAVRKAIARGTLAARVVTDEPVARGSGTLGGTYDVDPAEVERYRRAHLDTRTRGSVPLVTIHLPMDMGAVGRILAVVAETFPGSRVTKTENGSILVTDEPDDRPAVDVEVVIGSEETVQE